MSLLVFSFAAAGLQAEVDFEHEVLPILSHECRKCHGSDKDKGGLRLHTREAALAGGDDGPAIVPGDSEASELIFRVTTSDPDLRMPPKGDGLSEAETALLKQWIDEGAKWPEAADSKPYSMTLREVSVPEGEGHPVDRFLDAYFAKHDVSKPELVSDADYIRRVYFDVVGLPPSPGELDEYLNDASPGRDEAMVRRVLGDHTSYVNHWMTFWSDHLQVGSSVAGAVFNGDHTAAPRDWLFSQLQAGRGYNYFVSDVISNGYLDLYGKSVAPPGEETNPALTASMQSANMIGHVFLGVQLKCASCHDSFIDRWRMEDAWGLANALAPQPCETVRCNSPTGDTVSPRFLFPEIGSIDSSLGVPERQKRVAQLVVDGRNGLFHRTIVNRIWAHLFGRGLIDPIDEMVEHDAWDSELHEWLAMEIRRQGYDLKKFLLVLLTSDAYRYASVARGEALGEEASYVFEGPETRRLTAEQIVDTIRFVSNYWENSSEPRNGVARAWRHNNDSLMLALGRPTRDIITTSRDQSSNILQALELMNGDRLEALLQDESEELLTTAGGASSDELVEGLHRILFSRPPTTAEREIGNEMVGETPSAESVADWMWVLVSLPEFQLLN